MRYIYNRASTESQEFISQNKMIKDYLNRMGCNENIEIISEKISGNVSYKDRELYTLINKCNSGDIIYVSELSRFGRSMSDLFALVSDCSNKGITLIQCKDGTVIEYNSIGGKAILFALSLAAEIELGNIRLRTREALRAKKELGVKMGRANKNYKVNDENQQAGIIKSAKKRCENNVHSNEFIALCRILKRVYKPLNDLSTNDELFMLKWGDGKDEVLKSLTKDNLLVVMQNMVEANQYNNTLFAKYNFNDIDYMLKLLKSKIYAIFRSISTYNLYN